MAEAEYHNAGIIMDDQLDRSVDEGRDHEAVAGVEPTDLSTLTLLSRDAILRATDAQYEEVAVPEWGGKVRIKGLMGSERDKFESSLLVTNKKGDREFNTLNMRAKLVALSCVDGQGKRIFMDSDVAMLGEKSAAALERVYEIAARLSRISKADEDELVKNSKTDLSGGLATD